MRTGIEIFLDLRQGRTVDHAEVMALFELQATDGNELVKLQGFDLRARVKARNAALLEAAEVLGADGADAWKVAERLAKAIVYFETRVWPRMGDLGGKCRDAHGPLEIALHRAFLAGLRVPRTQRRLYDLLK